MRGPLGAQQPNMNQKTAMKKDLLKNRTTDPKRGRAIENHKIDEHFRMIEKKQKNTNNKAKVPRKGCKPHPKMASTKKMGRE